MNDRPLRRKYARVERERRFLLDELPPSVHDGEFERLKDLYVHGTDTRVRRVEKPNGDVLVIKLGQKMPDPDAPDDPSRRYMSTIYLNEGSGSIYESLPGYLSQKRRYLLAEQGWTFAIDVYERPASVEGLIICEVECETDEQLARITKPEWAVREITDDSCFSGFLIASGSLPFVQ